jgi:hypothetical protein
MIETERLQARVKGVEQPLALVRVALAREEGRVAPRPLDSRSTEPYALRQKRAT